MSIQKLWFIKVDNEIQGPFPANVITQRLFLNRVKISDMVSLDKLAWLPISEFEELLPQTKPEVKSINSDADVEALKWREERIKASRRWMDERAGERRGEESSLEGAAEDIGRTSSDRRKEIVGAETQSSRSQASKYRQMFNPKWKDYLSVVVFLVVAGAAIAVAMFVLAPVNPVKVDIGAVSSDCGKQATPKINWHACDKQGAWLESVNLSGANLNGTHFNSAVLRNGDLSYADLTGADLSYANLNGAKLTGANLQHANLNFAEFQGADLRQADLRGSSLETVVLSGAKLDNAVWSDGSICAPGSIGQCLNR